MQNGLLVQCSSLNIVCIMKKHDLFLNLCGIQRNNFCLHVQTYTNVKFCRNPVTWTNSIKTDTLNPPQNNLQANVSLFHGTSIALSLRLHPT